MKPIILSSLLLLVIADARSQWARVDSVFSPTGVIVQSFSAPQFADLDGDGDLDLLLGNGSSDKVKFYRNIYTTDVPHYAADTSVLASIYAGGIAGTNSDYPTVCDLDGDSLLDLVIGGYNGLLFYRNTGDAMNPAWERIDTVFAQVNTLIGTDARPAFGDLDGDGDLDLLVGIGESLFGGPPPGTTIGFRNIGSLTAPSFVQDNDLILVIPDVGLNAYPTLVDLDHDGDLDLLMGRDLQTMVYFRNTGTAATPVWTQNNTTVTGIEATTYWKDPTFADIDGDGDFDLVYGTSDGTLFTYRNTGTPTTPQFQNAPAYFAVIRINGGASTASAVDIDHDGDLDFISGDWLGGIQYFRNDGTSSSPAFTKTTATFTSLDAGSYSKPVFADVNGDTLVDIVSGALDGMLYCFLNTGTGWTQNTTLFAGIDVGFMSAPAFADIDNDGDPDLLVGAEDAGAIQFYRNQGGTFVSDPALLLNITSTSNAFPTFADLDGDGDFDLVIGGINGRLQYYENTGTVSAPVWTRNDAVLAGLTVRQNAAPLVTDFDGDGRPDIILGEYSGNFTFFRNLMPTAVHGAGNTDIPFGLTLSQNYPNPFNPTTTIAFRLPNRGHVELRVFDLLGRLVAEPFSDELSAGEHRITFDGSGIASGTYFYTLLAGNQHVTRAMVLLR